MLFEIFANLFHLIYGANDQAQLAILIYSLIVYFKITKKES